MSTATAVVTDPELQTEALTTVERANALTVVDNDTRELAAELGRAVAGLYKRAEEWFAPMKRLAAQAHREICNKEKTVLDPLETAKRYLSGQVGRYDQAQERRRREEEARQQEAARQTAEAEALRMAQETALVDAIALEAAGDTETAEKVLNNPVPLPVVVVPPVVVPRTVPKTAGVATAVTWRFRITNPDLVPNDYKLIDEKKIGQVVRAMKNLTNIPGVEPYPEGAARFTA